VFRQILTGAAGGKLTDERRAAISKTGIELSPASQGLSRARNRFSKRSKF